MRSTAGCFESPIPQNPLFLVAVVGVVTIGGFCGGKYPSKKVYFPSKSNSKISSVRKCCYLEPLTSDISSSNTMT